MRKLKYERAIYIVLSHLLSAAEISSVSAADISPELHSKCSESRDYKGCIEAHSRSSSKPNEQNEECREVDGGCIASKGKDNTGLRKREGWMYWQDDKSAMYYSTTHKIKHKGSFGRYIGNYYEYHYYDEGSTGTAPTQMTIGVAQTRCHSFGLGIINCHTTPAPVITKPGSPGRQPGYRSENGFRVLDCVDKTLAYYYNGKLSGKWKKLNANEIHKSWCTDIDKRPVMNVTL